MRYTSTPRNVPCELSSGSRLAPPIAGTLDSSIFAVPARVIIITFYSVQSTRIASSSDLASFRTRCCLSSGRSNSGRLALPFLITLRILCEIVSCDHRCKSRHTNKSCEHVPTVQDEVQYSPVSTSLLASLPEGIDRKVDRVQWGADLILPRDLRGRVEIKHRQG